MASIEIEGKIAIPGGYTIQWAQRYSFATDLPYLYMAMTISYPLTPDHKFDKSKASRLGRRWDTRWQEIVPFEMVPFLGTTLDSPVTIWKHNFLNDVTHYTFDNSFAFCPMRVRCKGDDQNIHLNPFGTYHGKQLRYPSARTGFGRAMALLMADQLESYAPSYAGKKSRFSLMLAPYQGGSPPKSLQRDALIFSTPPTVR